MTAAREDVQARACDLAGDDLAQGARHQDVVVRRNHQGRRADVSKAIAGIMGEQRIDPRQHDIGRRMPGGLTRSASSGGNPAGSVSVRPKSS